jgi:hypothetical protein
MSTNTENPPGIRPHFSLRIDNMFVRDMTLSMGRIRAMEQYPQTNITAMTSSYVSTLLGLHRDCQWELLLMKRVLKLIPRW